MPPKLTTDEGLQTAATETGRTATALLGKDIPNLLIVWDSGEQKVEFRVQCEVPLDPEEADQLLTDLRRPRTRQSVARAKQFVLDRLDPGATERFKKIVELAFDDQREMQ
jgi:hypothetical protein